MNYDRDDQLIPMKEIVIDFLSRSAEVPREHLVAWSTEFGSRLVTYGLSCKSEGFREEKEWRIVKAFPRDEWMMQVEFRSGRWGLIPYYKIPVANPEGATAIREIVIGPTRFGDDAVRAVQMLLKARGLEEAGIEIRESGIPIR